MTELYCINTEINSDDNKYKYTCPFGKQYPTTYAERSFALEKGAHQMQGYKQLTLTWLKSVYCLFQIQATV